MMINSKDAIPIVFRCIKITLTATTLLAALLASIGAQAVPSFARQTGQECAACHVGGFGPQLTPFGRAFKLTGYTQKAGNDYVIPLSAMMVGVYDSTAKSIPADSVAPNFSDNNNSALQEASLFVAGAASDHVGGFLQVTYSGIERATAIDNMDIRFAKTTLLGGESATLGISVNNNPGNQDVWNTLPAWGFPYMASDLAPAPNAAPLLAGGLAQQVMGVSGYVLWNDNWYGEFGLYQTPSTTFLKRTHVIGSVDDLADVAGSAPYWRLAYTNSVNRQNISVGLFGLSANIRPGALTGPSDKYRDIGVDSSYQIMGTGKHIFSVNASYIHESQTLTADVAAESADVLDNKLNTFSLNGSYYFKNTYGVTLGYFNTGGSKADMTRFGAEALDGSRTGLADSEGYVLQTDYTPFGKESSWAAPFANVRLGLQYTAYTKFNGANHNYDGEGRNASDNNTLMLLLWLSI